MSYYLTYTAIFSNCPIHKLITPLKEVLTYMISKFPEIQLSNNLCKKIPILKSKVNNREYTNNSIIGKYGNFKKCTICIQKRPISLCIILL